MLNKLFLVFLAATLLLPVTAQGARLPLSESASGISAGAYHTCVVVSGGVRCWGRNEDGELGDGTQTGRKTPVEVDGLEGTVIQVAAGGFHTCALLDSGTVKCWGRNSSGQLGNGDDSGADSTTPVDVLDLEDVVAIDAGGAHTCALTGGGGLFCWGSNSSGQIGYGAQGANRLEPVQVEGLNEGVAALSAGYNHTCAVTQASSVLCWGGNGSGQLGDGTTTGRLTPVEAGSLSGAGKEVLAGYEYSCALTTAGGAKCWGANASGQLGDGTNEAHSTPGEVYGLSSGVSALGQGAGWHACALLDAGDAQCWGAGSEGQLGDGASLSRNLPTSVTGAAGTLSAIVTGVQHTCGLDHNGGAWCWGYNGYGQLGDGTMTNRPAMVQVSGLEAEPYDLALDYVTLAPYSPRAMSDASLQFRVSNQGQGTYMPASGAYAVEVSLTDTGQTPNPIATYRFPGTGLKALAPGASAILEISGFWFTRPTVTRLDLTFLPQDADANPANQSASQAIALQAAEESISGCLAPTLEVIAFGSALDGVSDSALEAISADYPATATRMGEALADEGAAAAWNAGLDYILRSGIRIAGDTGADLTQAAIRLAADFFQALADEPDCDLPLDEALLRLANGFNAAGAGLNAVYAEGPVYLLIENESGKQVGFTNAGATVSEIAGAQALSSSSGRSLLLVPGRNLAQVRVYGTGTGAFDLTLALAWPDQSTANAQYTGVAITDPASGTIDLADPDLPLEFDDDGDSDADRRIMPGTLKILRPGKAYLPLIRASGN